MKLRDVLKDIEYAGIIGPQDVEITGISINSKKIKMGNLFLSITGFKKDGHDFAREAVQMAQRLQWCRKSWNFQKI